MEKSEYIEDLEFEMQEVLKNLKLIEELKNKDLNDPVIFKALKMTLIDFSEAFIEMIKLRFYLFENKDKKPTSTREIITYYTDIKDFTEKILELRNFSVHEFYYRDEEETKKLLREYSELIIKNKEKIIKFVKETIGLLE
jgi:hypothetical protein